MSQWLVSGALSLCVAGFSSSARASLIASDNFESYTSGSSAIGLNGGTGFTGAYTSDDTTGLTIGTQTLTYTNGAFTLSGAAQDLKVGATNDNLGATAIDNSTLDRQFATQNGNAVYFSFLLQANAGATSNNEFFQLGLSNSVASPTQSVVVSGSTAANFDFSVRNATTPTSSSILFSPLTTYFIVGEVSIASGSDYNLINLWVNPGATQPGSPSITATGDSGASTLSFLDIRTARYTSTDVFSVDNVMIGTTYADVVPATVPEPATGGLLLMGAGFGLCSRLRRRSGE